MTTSTLTRPSAYPKAIEDLMPAARALISADGELPSRNRLKAELRIGAPKAREVLAALQAETGADTGTDAAPGRHLHAVPDAARGAGPVGLSTVNGPGMEDPGGVLAPERTQAMATPTATEGGQSPTEPALDPATESEAVDPVLARATDLATTLAVKGYSGTEIAEDIRRLYPGVDPNLVPFVDPDPVPMVEASPHLTPVVDPGTGTGTPTVEQDAGKPRSVSVWPLWLLALPAIVAIWSGWVGLGELAGFGMVRPLPGILDGFEINSAITLPIGMEVYAAYALRVWLSGSVPGRARDFARASALGSLLLGGLGQVAYHLMTAYGMTTAPWWVITLVACLPVAVLGMGATLAHLIKEDR